MANSFEIRFAKEEEKAQVEDLWAYSFHHDSEAFRRWYFKDYYRHKECLVAIGADGDIYASLQLITTSLEKDGKALKGAYIVGVDVKPEARDEKLAKRLMLYAEEYAIKEAFDFLLLMPFEAGFYTRFGYSFVDYHYLIGLPLNELKNSDKKGRFEKIDFDALPTSVLLSLYQASQASYLVRLVREARHINALASDTRLEGGHAYLYYRDAKPVGYIFYTLTDTFNVRELVYLDEEARGALYHFILSHASQVAQLKWNAPITEPLVYERMIDKTSVVLYPFIMAKLMKIEAFISPYKKGEICFNLKSANGDITTYLLNPSGLKKLEHFTNEVSFELSEQSLTKLAFGRHLVEKVLPNTLISDTDWQAFLALFEKGNLYFNEYF